MSPSASTPVRGGIDLGGTKIQTVVVDASHDVLGEARRRTPTTGGPEAVAGEMIAAMREAAEQAGIETGDLVGIGIGAPGNADKETGDVSNVGNIPGWEEPFPLGKTISDDLGTPTKIGGDVQVAAEAEFSLGAGRPYESLLCVFWGTGVGGGLILDRRPWLGRGEAGEIGHMVIKRGGARCTCGRRGCMEAYAGRKAMELKARREVKRGAKTDLFKLMEKHHRDHLSSGIWARALDRGDELATGLMDRAVKALAAGVASAVNLLDPEAVIFGGGMGTRFGESHVPHIEARMKRHLFVDQNPPAIHVTALGDFGGAIGAALLVADAKSATTAAAPKEAAAAS